MAANRPLESPKRLTVPDTINITRVVMTPEQRNDLCIEWEYTNTATRHQIIEEYRKQRAKTQQWDDWEEFMVERLRLEAFWKTVGLS